MQTFRKVYGWFIRYRKGDAQLLVFTAPDGSFRFPGGTVNDDEELLEGLRRELGEEMGISEFKVIRKLGVRAYYKPDVRKYVERHEYLLSATAPLPDEFSYTVQSHDKDDGMFFDYHWISREDIGQLDWEFREHVKPEYIPEFFPQRDCS
jgi:8-oxo-dGTP pyrophosphatase MutT (NUDIX family)